MAALTRQGNESAICEALGRLSTAVVATAPRTSLKRIGITDAVSSPCVVTVGHAAPSEMAGSAVGNGWQSARMAAA